MTEIEIFINNIKRLMQKFDLTESQMSEILRISYRQMKEIVEGRLPDDLTADVIFYIYKHFGIEPFNQFSPID